MKSWMLVPVFAPHSACIARAASAFQRSLAILLEGLQFSSSRQGRGRWMASTASRYIEGRAIETNEPCYITAAQRSTVRLGWNQRRQLLHRSPESWSPWKSAFSRRRLCSSLTGIRSFVFSLCDLFLIENKQQTIWPLKTFQALLSDAGNKLWHPSIPGGIIVFISERKHFPHASVIISDTRWKWNIMIAL